MEVSFLTRGCKRDVDDFITQLQGKYVPMAEKNPDGTIKGYVPTQLLVKPIQLWEVAFPEEHMELILNTIFGDGRGKNEKKDKNLDKYVYFLRKIMRAEKIPDKIDNKRFLPTGRQNIQLVGIGIRKDKPVVYPDGSSHDGI